MDYKGKKLYMISSTHWDREWYQTFQGFRYRLVQVLDRAIDFLETHPEFPAFTLDGQTVVIEDYLEIRPENRERIEKLIREGRLLVGPWYCMPDEFIISGESLITNLQIGDRLSKKYGGQPWKYGYICDIFGHTAQMAQIFNGFGIRYAMLGRGTRKAETPSHFLWQAPDGSNCITYRLEGRGGYGMVAQHIIPLIKEDTTDEQIDEILKNEVDYQFSLTKFPIALFTDGIDHADLHPQLLDYAERIRRLCPGIEVIIGDLTDMGKDLESFRPEMLVKCGELNRHQRDRSDDMELITNTLSSRYDIKKENDICQTLMEKWVQPMTLAASLGGKEIPQNYVDLAYRSLITNHPHDSICGCSISQVHTDMKYRFAQTREIANEIITDITYQQRLTLQGDGKNGMLTVYNPLPYERDEVIHVELLFDPSFQNKYMEPFYYDDDINCFDIFDEQGNRIPYTLHKIHHGSFEHSHGPNLDYGDGHFISLRVHLNAGGYTRFSVVPSQRPTRPIGSLVTSPTSAENDLIRLDINADGTLKITDKQNGKTYDRLVSYLDDSEIGDGWFHCCTVDNRVVSSIGSPCTISIDADGPARCVFRVVNEMRLPKEITRMTHRMKHFHRSEETVVTKVTSFVCLDAGSKVVKVKTVFDNNVLNHRLRMLAETGIEGKTYFANEAFCFVERTCGTDPSSYEWVEADLPERAMSGIVGKAGADGCGLAIVSARGLHECAGYENGRLTITLLRAFSQTVQTNGEPEGQLTGELTYEYALCPFGPQEEKASLQRLQDCLSTGIETTFSRARDDAEITGKSFLALEGDEAICFSTAKRPIDLREKTAIVRVYNDSDHPAKGALVFANPVQSASLCDLLENRTDDVAFQGCRVELSLEPWKIATVRVSF